MLLIKTKIGPSKINGIGLFANQFIPKGTIIWKFHSGFDIKIDKNELAKLPEITKECFLKYAYLNPDTNKYILCLDDARFFNHSDNPNCIDESPEEENEGITFAARGIQQGEELTSDYRKYDADYDYKMSIP
jgi:SET domain-containing protein